MVSPLQTWQHPESKRLWFILGGLSVLVHIGLLGLSLPYVLRLMEPSTAAVSAVPIELVTVDPVSGKPIENADSDRLSAAATSTAQPETDTDIDTATNPPAVPNSDPSLPTDPNSFSTQAPANSPAPNRNTDPATSDPATSDPTTSPDPTPPSNSGRPTRPSQPPTGTEPSSDSGSGSGSGTSSSRDSGDGSSDASNDASDDSSGDGSGDALTSLSGSGPLQPPGSEGTSTTVQVAALRVTGTRLDVVQDVKDQPPQLLSSMAAIALEPERVGCDRVDFSAGPLGPLTYRVAIDTDSSIRTLTLQTQGGSSLSLANEEAIACLIRSAGFTFLAAVSDGTPILDDSLLLTLDVIESQPDTAP
ncbi:MAG: hypothetical protein DCF15_01570 [Phormidesmis priestleyi]|uniref:Uncharacterized protein n=1 Tax=Phormidesmis priestleyi TaxID=268141 RepID=A0A2W4ZQA1_9CYAN|nr:MAG: hypothetical protein DCF15_01570 [Phormidesmis priestleyi]